MATMRSVGGHEEDDIDLLVESSVPLFAKCFGEATAGPAIDIRIPVLVKAVVGIDFVPQSVQHGRPALVRGNGGRFSEHPVPPPGDGNDDNTADPDTHADPPPGPTAAGGSRVPIVRVHCSVPYRMKSSPRWKSIRR